MPTTADLAPFGFTATESLVYGALLRLGPSTGYGIAHATRVARANTYHALEGLAGRAAAVRLAGRPARYRAADPRALLAQLAAEQGDALDRLSRALREASTPAEPDTRSISGARALANVILQLVARAERRVEGVLASELVRPTLPAWRRARERATLALRVAGDVPAEAQALGAESAPAETPTLLLIDAAHVVVANGNGEAATGIWSSHPALAALVRLALGALGGAGAPGAPGQAP
jgi:sugar-specific transcriptional regulator TrmB